MSATQVSANAPAASSTARGRSVLDVVMIVGLLIAGLDFAAPQLLSGHIIPPAMIFAVADLVALVLVATRWRWAMIVALIVGLASVVLDVTPGFPQYALTHPGDHFQFTSFVLHLATNLMVVCAAGAKLAQAVRHQAPGTPRWFVATLSAVAGLASGALLVGATAQFSGAVSTNTAQAGTETVHLVAASFVPNIVALHKGDTLTIVDDAPIAHTLTNGTWTSDNKPVPGTEPGAPLVNNVTVNNTTVSVGPFTTPGTYHIYCTIHPGMSLTILVQ